MVNGENMFKNIMGLKLQTKLMMFFVLITLIPLISLGLFTYQFSSNMLKEELSNGIMENLNQINKNLAFFTKDVEQLSNYIYRSDLVQEKLNKSADRTNLEKYHDFKEVNEMFDTILGTKTWSMNLYIIGLNGDRYFTGDYLPLSYSQITENWGVFRKAKDAQGAVVWDTHYTIKHIEEQEVVLRVGRQLKSQANEPLGYLVIDILEPSISALYQSENHSQVNQMYLLDSQGYIVSSNPSKTTIGTKIEHESGDMVLNSQRGFFETKINGKNYMAIFDTNQDTHYKVVNYLAESEIIKKTHSIKYLTLLLIVIAFIVSLWFSYLFTKTITSPINRLKSVMKEVEKGNLEVQFISEYKDEVNELGQNFNTMISKLKTSIKDSLEKKTRLQEAEVNTLRAQINPHFLYNTLETMSAIAKIKGVRMISDLAIALGEMMRYSLKKDSEFVSLQEELFLLERYLFIQKTRFHTKIDVSIVVEEETNGLMLPPLLIQPLVENAIIHGLEPKVGKGELSIHIYKEKNELLVEIKDDGIGIDKERLNELNLLLNTKEASKSLGIGMENVVKRIHLYYGKEYGLSIKSQKNEGTTVIMKLPVKHREEKAHD